MFAGLTVRQHLTLAYRVRKDRSRLWKDMFNGASLRKPDKAEVERVQRLLELLSLADISESLVDTLPLGTTRLVEVGRALASGPVSGAVGRAAVRARRQRGQPAGRRICAGRWPTRASRC